uniref:Uncharacterized protein n=1 Tax=Solanum tuberosum TaxID=4113 RepID=M1DQP2_SOLTU
MQVVHGRSKHKLILPNELNQPIGPTKEVVSELGSFLGTSARNGTVCPLNVFNWKMLKTHDDMWNYIKGDSGPSSQTVDDEMMQKKIEEMKERMQQRMQEKFNAQKDTMERDVTVNIIAQLQHLNPRLTLDPNMLGLTVGSPRGRAALQLINRPSVGCNNQG